MVRAAIVPISLVVAGLLVLAGFRLGNDPGLPPGEGLTVHGPDRDLGELSAGAEASVRFRVTNRSGRPNLIVGLVPG